MNELVCLDMPTGAAFVDRIKRAWDEGDAIFPLDQRLPAPARERTLQSIRPSVIASINGEARIDGDGIESGDAVVVATSGTTGNPKGVILTHTAIEASARATSERLNVNTDDKWFACLPTSHVGGLSVILRSLVVGTPLVIAPSFSVEAYDAAAADGATLVSLVATAMQRVDTNKFRKIVLGGARPPKKRPANSITTYGMTETGSGVVYDGVPLSGVEIKIDNGVVHLRAPMLLRSYRDGTIPLDNEGWFRTGDIGTFENGSLQVDGREGDLIITGGENVWPESVEDAIKKHPSILDVCVAGANDAEWGQRVVAWVVTSSDIGLDELRDVVKETLPSHCAPRQVIAVNEIPRTALGKPQRSELLKSLLP